MVTALRRLRAPFRIAAATSRPTRPKSALSKARTSRTSSSTTPTAAWSGTRPITSPDYAIDGAAGGEIDSAVVKSGTTTESFDCVLETRPPTAILEVKTPECNTWPDGFVNCSGQVARTTWSRSTTDFGYGFISFFCSWPDDQSCVDAVMPCEQIELYSACRVTYTFRGTSSTDPDNDLTSWSLDFGDGTSLAGDWTTNPPTEISHEYLDRHCPTCSREPATLTVTDSAGQTDADAQFVFHTYPE